MRVMRKGERLPLRDPDRGDTVGLRRMVILSTLTMIPWPSLATKYCPRAAHKPETHYK